MSFDLHFWDSSQFALMNFSLLNLSHSLDFSSFVVGGLSYHSLNEAMSRNAESAYCLIFIFHF